MFYRTLAHLCAAAALLAMVLPSAQAQTSPEVSTPTTLYFHVFDTFNPFPINTQAPDVSYFEVGGNNFPTAPAPPGYDFHFNTIYGFATPGPVEYNFIENGQPRFHRERGIAAEVKIDASVQPIVHMYLQVRDLVGLRLEGNALPSFTFHAEMREGNQVGADKDLDAKPLIMGGQLTLDVLDPKACAPDPTTVNPNDPGATKPLVCQSFSSEVGNQTNPLTGNQIAVPDGEGIIEFRIPMDFSQETIPKGDAYHVRIDWYQNPTTDASHNGEAAEGFMRLASDANHHPRLEMAIKNPIYIDYIHPEVAAGILLIHSCVNSPWGTYDADVANMTVSVTGPSKPAQLQEVVSQNKHTHNAHDKCAEVTYLWRFRDESAKNGAYAIEIKVPNLAGNAKAVGTGGFNVEGKQAYGIDQNSQTVAPIAESTTVASPAAGLLLAAAALGCAAIARRRMP